MMQPTIWALLATLLSARAAVPVQGTRLYLGDLAPNLEQPWAAVDLGPTPQPLQQRRLRAAEIAQAVARANLPPVRARLAASYQLVREGQHVSQVQLRSWIEASLRPRLPPGAILRSLVVTAGLDAGPGTVDVSLHWPARPISGRQSLRVQLSTADGWNHTLPVLVDVQLPAQAFQGAIERGQRITIVLESAGVRLESTGVAQQRGAVGDTIRVLPNVGNRVLQARVRDRSTVEVDS